MDTRRLYSFVRVVDAGSITRAADLLHIAQPALSQQMTALESLFGRSCSRAASRGSSRVSPPPAPRRAGRPWASPRPEHAHSGVHGRSRGTQAGTAAR